MTDYVYPALPPRAPTPLYAEVERIWPDHQRSMPSASAGLAALAGIGAAILLPDTPPGLGVVLVGLLIAVAVLPTLRPRIRAHEITFGTLAIIVLAMVALRSAEWFVSLCLLGTLALASYALAPGRTMLNAVLASSSLPLAAARSLPWIRRGLRNFAPAWRGRHNIGSIARTAGISIFVILVFCALFASADAAFAALLPELNLASVPLRVFIFCLTAGIATAAAFLAAAPPNWDSLAPSQGRSVRASEWVVPIAALDVIFATFVGVQLAVLFGGHDHVLQTSGLTYAEYARSGFGQLVMVTLLTLAVVAAVARWAPRQTLRERVTLRVLLGLLCALSLVVVASALYRLHLYEEAFGFTRLRLFMNVFETSLAVVLGLVLVAGIKLSGAWLARGVVATGAVALLVLAVLNPDGFVASRNVERFEATGKIDQSYLQTLSADAVPAIDRLPEPVRSCVLGEIVVPTGGGFAGWNLGRARAQAVFDKRPRGEVLAASGCVDGAVAWE